MNLRKAGKELFTTAWLRKPVFKVVLAVFLFGLIIVAGTTLYYYRYYSDVIDRRLGGEVFQRTASLYAAPFRIYGGQKLTREAVITRLQHAGFEPEGSAHPGAGTYELVKERLLTIRPAGGDAIQLRFDGDRLGAIKKAKGGELAETLLPAELVTGLSDDSRQKRRIVAFKELPPALVNALIAAEDNRFYRHFGIDPIRLAGAVVQSFPKLSQMRGTSTLTQQLARNFFLPETRLKRSPIRKTHEIFIAFLLEQRLTKEQILTLYANDVYLGARGSFQIKGFGEAAATYFGKDLTAINLPEAATLAAIIPAASGQFSPIKHPDKAKERRNLVLNAMAGLGFITPDEAKNAKESELTLAALNKVDTSGAPYLVDYIRDSLLKDFSEDALNNDGLRIETTMDPDLQKAAVDALVKGLNEVNTVVAERNKKRKPGNQLPEAQGSIIVLDRKTAGILAMAGGANYATSQLNRVTHAFRQPGSIFKPIAYAAAFEQCEQHLNDVGGDDIPDTLELSQLGPAGAIEECITPATLVEDVETVFLYDGEKTYEPNNYHEQYNGLVTVRYALEHSLNVPTIKIAEAIGYEKVANLAKRSGLNAKIKGYPSIALGAFEVTPLEMAGAYTVFANEGMRLEPHALARVLAADGTVLRRYKYPETRVLSPQVAYLMTSIMEGVIKHGTGVGVGARGFTLPAAGKTGTSRDGWFAGYTKDYVVIAWVGFDDNTDLNIEGARSALPIWTDFMLKAQELYPPRDLDAMYFQPPDSVAQVTVEHDSSEVPIKGCANDYVESFLAGSVGSSVRCGRPQPEPVSGFFKDVGGFFGRLFGGDDPKPTEPSDNRAKPSTSSH
ncbi:MAG TPA: transglycosylase domain-containing protein [Terriglobia bacterium]|nr:transglycosylase domain-containing protein [Terriglobia bacterium]